MKKFSKKQQKCQKATKKSINLRYCTVLYLSWGLQGFAKILHKFTSKKCLFALIGIFSFQKITFLH